MSRSCRGSSLFGRLTVTVAAGLLLGQDVLAAPGFIAGSRITKGNYLAEISVEFRCGVQYLSHEPQGRGNQLRIHLESTGICNGVSPLAANSHEQHRPARADDAQLDSIEYDGETSGTATLRMNFDDEVRYAIAPSSNSNTLIVRVFLGEPQQQPLPGVAAGALHKVSNAPSSTPQYVINLASSVRAPGVGDAPTVSPGDGRRFFYSTAVIDGTTWHRLRLGYFETPAAASAALKTFRADYPTAWVDRVTEAEKGIELPVNDAVIIPDVATASQAASLTTASSPASIPADTASNTGGASASSDKVAELMADARKAMTAGEISRAVQIYTKVLQMPGNEYQQEAQEFLALARERNGQLAHAKAEYRRYLAMYPDSEGTARVEQRLAALLSQSGEVRRTASPAAPTARSGRASHRSPWNVRTFLSQYYRRDVNQINDNDEVVSQSSLYSDINVDLRRRGERFDFSTRLTAGYRLDMLEESAGSGNDLRLSYAYADLADTRSGLRGRIGRQSRNSGGILGRFDGVNMAYQATERLRFDAVAGKPVFSTADGVDNARTFYGLSTNFGPLGDNLDVGAFFLQQTIDGLTDRQVVGGEMRYFAENRSLWGLLDYDTSFKEIGSAFLQGSWRFPGLFSVSALLDRRRSPFLSTGNAAIGQSGLSFAELAGTMTEAELRELALDRAATTTTMTLGLSRPLNTKLQLSINASEASVQPTPESGGVAATPATRYRYYSTDLVASSLVKQGDVSIFGVRYADSDTTRVWSLNLDTRFPIGRAFRINPRLRVDKRFIKSDESDEWIYTPGIRMQYRWKRSLRLELEAGKRFASREMVDSDLDRESYFINFGYQFFY